MNIKVVNGTTYALFSNFTFHYNKGTDSSGVLQILNEPGNYLAPGDTMIFSSQETALSIYSYDYDCDYDNEQGIHQDIHCGLKTFLDFKTGQENIIDVTYTARYFPPERFSRSFIIAAVTYITALIILLLVGYFIRKRSLQRKRKLQQALLIEEERKRISAEMHDDIGSGLFAVRLQSELLARKSMDSDVQKAIADIGDSVLDISSKVREAIWSIDPKNDTLDSLISFIRLQSAKIFEPSPIVFMAYCNSEIPSCMVKGEFRRDIYLLVKEALHNILKHSNASIAEIIFTVQKQHLEIKIRDNGMGFNVSVKQLNGMGLRNMNARVKNISGDIDIDTSPAGTFITILIALNALKSQ